MKNNQAPFVSDKELLESYLVEPSAKITEILYNRYYAAIFHYCLHLLKNQDDAFDQTQEVFIKSFDKIGQLKKLNYYEHWLKRITHNSCINFLKKKNRSRKETAALVRFYQPTAEGGRDDWKGFVENVDFVLTQLPPQTVEMLKLKYNDDISILELQKRYGISKSAVKMRLARARNKMKKQFEEIIAA